jgi:hypothetical protein
MLATVNQSLRDLGILKRQHALVKLVAERLAAEESISDETVTLIEAYLHELRGTSLESKLMETQVVILSQSRKFAEAFELLEGLNPTLTLETSSSLLNAVLENLGKNADDVVFLDHIFGLDDFSLASLATETTLLLATRVLDLGFAAQAQEMLEYVPATQQKSMRQLIAARAAIQLGQPFQAQAALIGIESPEGLLLLAQAKQMTGSYREAAEIFTSNNKLEQAAHAAWLSDDWRELTSPDTPGLGAIATLGQMGGIVDDGSSGPLGRADEALKESASVRAMLGQLLSDPSVQITPNL